MFIIALANHKGGSSKSTSSINLGSCLAKMGKRVLIIDLDAQANTTMGLGIKSPKKDLYGVMKEDYPISESIIQVKENLDIVPSALEVGALELELVSEPAKELILRRHLENISGKYDVVLLDCPPNLGVMTINGLSSATQVIIPMQAEFFGAQGLTTIISIIEKIKKRLNPSLALGGIFFSRYSGRKSLSKGIFGSVERAFAGSVFNTKIRECVALSECQLKGMDIFSYDAKSNGAKDYQSLSQEIYEKLLNG